MPLDTSYQMPKSEKKTYDLLPDDVYECVVKDVEKKISAFKDEKTGEEKETFEFTFSIQEPKYSGRLLWKEIAPFCYYSKKGASVLLSLVNAINGHDLTPDEAEAVGAADINALVGKQVRVNVGHKVSGSGKTYNNVLNFLPTKRSGEVEMADLKSIPF